MQTAQTQVQTPAQQLATVYQYFTLEEWKLMAQALELAVYEGHFDNLAESKVQKLLTKFPSAAL